ncbi:S9 family peptidase [Paenibacillus sp. KACC 21273]|uniref:S9 family peptidase n=1 Tax=Paenibacillus sp. KACC 21273 TaxID=3025665 RepID=UPI002365E3DC|nr:S9 family peptidase [Paenibacillus sp. KACC 21273]WDF49398.1 S9 family peptidase [Paenibacillus sp. KACC 21273]
MSQTTIQPEDLYKYNWVSDPSIHPDGAIAYVYKSIDAERNQYKTHIYYQSADRKQKKRITDGDYDYAPDWSPNGRYLAFIRKTDHKPQLWILDMIDSSINQYSKLERGIGLFRWSPDGRSIILTSRVIGEREVEAHAPDRGQIVERTTPKAEGSGLWNGTYQHLFLLELSTRQMTQITEGDFDASSPVWSPDGTEISYLAQKNASIIYSDMDLVFYQDLYTLEIASGHTEIQTNHDLMISQFAYAPDRKSWTCIANDREYGSGTQNQVYRIDRSTKQIRSLTPQSQIQFGNFILNDMKTAAAIPGPIYSTDGQSIYVLGTYQGSVDLYRITEEGVCTPITTGGKDIHQIVYAPQQDIMVALVSDATHPYELVTFPFLPVSNIQWDEVKPLTNTHLWLADYNVSVPQLFWYTNKEGIQIQGWLMKPTDIVDHDSKIPLILQIHGGPHAMYSDAYSHEMQALVSQGYAVMMINPRGSFGYGQHFAQACRQDFGGGDYRDLLEAVDYILQHHPECNDHQLGICGGSYGGLMVNWIIAHDDRFRVAVTQRCISNWISFYGISDIGISYTEGIIGGNPWEDTERLWSQSPLAHVQQIETPLLIIHGEQDMRCPIEQGEQLYTALKRQGKVTKMVRYPDSNHMVLKSGKPSYRVDLLTHVNDWIKQYIGSPLEVHL